MPIKVEDMNAAMAKAMVVAYGDEAQKLCEAMAVVLRPVIAEHSKAATLIAYVALIANAINSPEDQRAPKSFDEIVLALMREFCAKRHEVPSTPTDVQ
jgi:hypothetical protein